MAASRFVIVQQRPASPWRLPLLILLWLASLAACAVLTYRFAVPQAQSALLKLDQVEAELLAAQQALEQALQKVAVLDRSEQVSRDATKELQRMLAEREEENAGLRADVTFYERLVGGSAQRKGLSVHSVEFHQRGDGDLSFAVVLTQNLKKAALTRGDLRFALEGARSGQLTTLDWSTLRQQTDAPAAAFEFRYFQRVEGSVVVPADFTPHRVRLRVERDGAVIERTIPWEDTQVSEGE